MFAFAKIILLKNVSIGLVKIALNPRTLRNLFQKYSFFTSSSRCFISFIRNQSIEKITIRRIFVISYACFNLIPFDPFFSIQFYILVNKQKLVKYQQFIDIRLASARVFVRVEVENGSRRILFGFHVLNFVNIMRNLRLPLHPSSNEHTV